MSESQNEASIEISGTAQRERLRLNDLRVTVPIILMFGIFGAAWKGEKLTVAYLDSFFVTDVEAAEADVKTQSAINNLGKDVQQLAQSFSAYVRRQDIKDLVRQISTTEDTIRQLEREIASGGHTNLRDAQLIDAQSRLRMLQAQKRCMLDAAVSDKSNCDLE